MNKKIMYAGIAVIIALLWTIAFLLGSNTSKAVTDEGEIPQQQISVVDQVKETILPKEDTLEDLVTVSDPFGDESSVGMTLSTTDSVSFPDLIATMDFTMNQQAQVQLEGNFKDTLMGNTSVTSNEKMSIVHKTTYDADSELLWTQDEDDNFSWNQDPSRESLPFGSVVKVTYSTQDATGMWTGDIQIDRHDD